MNAVDPQIQMREALRQYYLDCMLEIWAALKPELLEPVKFPARRRRRDREIPKAA